MEYCIHRNGLVTLGDKVVGECVTGEDGLAYVEFLNQDDVPEDAWFTVYVGESALGTLH